VSSRLEIASYKSLNRAELARDLLDGAGIESVLTDLAAAFAGASAAFPVRLLVDRESAERAVAILVESGLVD